MNLIIGGEHQDDRGRLLHFNDFDMSAIQRFYAISPADTATIRAWQGHQYEQKWFYCSQGAFLLKTVAVDDWQTPSKDLPVRQQVLTAKDPVVLHVPGGYANGFQALEAQSMLMVYSDFSLSASGKDDFRFPLTQWTW